MFSRWADSRSAGIDIGIAACYAAAFASLIPNIYGLNGPDGVLPYDRFLGSILGGGHPSLSTVSHVPSILWFAGDFGLPYDVLAQGAAAMGLLLSLAALVVPCYVLFAIVWLLYMSFLVSDQTFMSFQWDILLYEAGFVAILHAPLLPSGTWFALSGREHVLARPPPARWAFRFLLFKLMLLSGYVKLQSGCSTWQELTATEYHFATQPLPTPLAWGLHQVPPILHKVAVAVTMWAEGPGAFLLLVPHSGIAAFGAYTQLVLQVAISLSGNYTFFNMLTMVLCAAVLQNSVPLGLPAAATQPGASRPLAALAADPGASAYTRPAAADPAPPSDNEESEAGVGETNSSPAETGSQHLQRGLSFLLWSARTEGLPMAARRLWAWLEGSTASWVLGLAFCLWYVAVTATAMFELTWVSLIPAGEGADGSQQVSVARVRSLGDFLKAWGDGGVPLWQRFDLRMGMTLEDANAWLVVLLPLALWAFSIVWALSCLLYLGDQARLGSCCGLLRQEPLGGGSDERWDSRLEFRATDEPAADSLGQAELLPDCDNHNPASTDADEASNRGNPGKATTRRRKIANSPVDETDAPSAPPAAPEVDRVSSGAGTEQEEQQRSPGSCDSGTAGTSMSPCSCIKFVFPLLWRSIAGVLMLLHAFGVCALLALWLCASVVPLQQGLSPSHLRGRAAPKLLQDVAVKLHNWHVASGYGLFRSMTGVGQSAEDSLGRHVSVPARPELVIEGARFPAEVVGGQLSADVLDWKELPFHHKPQDVLAPPTKVVPFQPRLDWQMWFAALGSYQQAPWLLRTVDRVLDGSPDVIGLFDVSKWPFSPNGSVATRRVEPEDVVDLPASGPVVRPDAIRIRRYAYDFTRLDTPWARRLPADRHGEAILSWGAFAEPANRSTNGSAAVEAGVDSIGRHALLLLGRALGSAAAAEALQTDEAPSSRANGSAEQPGGTNGRLPWYYRRAESGDWLVPITRGQITGELERNQWKPVPAAERKTLLDARSTCSFGIGDQPGAQWVPEPLLRDYEGRGNNTDAETAWALVRVGTAAFSLWQQASAEISPFLGWALQPPAVLRAALGWTSVVKAPRGRAFSKALLSFLDAIGALLGMLASHAIRGLGAVRAMRWAGRPLCRLARSSQRFAIDHADDGGFPSAPWGMAIAAAVGVRLLASGLGVWLSSCRPRVRHSTAAKLKVE